MTDETQETTGGADKKEVVVVASKIKAYIKSNSGLNTSGAVMEVLSEQVRQLCDRAVENAKRDNRKTVMDRDFGTSVN